MKLVIGASGGVGQGLLAAWSDTPGTGTYHNHPPASPEQKGSADWQPCDVLQPDWAYTLLDAVGPQLPETIVLCTGLLHDGDRQPEKSITRFDRDWFTRSIATNTQPFGELAAAVTTRARRDQAVKLAVISAKVGSISDNNLGGWYSYRASKAALNMLVRTTAIEWRHRLPNSTLLALHPGTTDSGLSAPFQKRLPEGQLHSPEYTGQTLANLIDQATPADSGSFLSWDGSLLPW
jgi:NAD(P)-dependent dehydrogenase (short-subunit alcohol dehydrogenase family)